MADTDDLLDQLGIFIDGIVAQECARHYPAPTQEHQFTSRLAQAIESELKHYPLPGLDVEVVTQDFPDRGPGSMEKRTGADLYISVVRRDGEEPVSKGMLVQSKWDHALRHSGERKRLRGQAHDMLERTDDAYVWIYESSGVAVVPAVAALSLPARLPRALRPQGTIGGLVAAGLKCRAGDRAIGRNLDQPLVSSLDDMMTRLSANAAIEFTLDRGG